MSEVAAEMKCNCAHIPDKWPGEDHLIDCPVRAWAELNDAEQMRADYEKARELIRLCDVNGIVALLGRSNGDRAHAAYLRSRYPKEPEDGGER